MARRSIKRAPFGVFESEGEIVKIFFAIICFGIGVAFAIGAIHAMLYPSPYGSSSFDAAMPGMISAMGSFLLLRRKLPSSV
jgi:hypothetical protein